MFSMGLSGLCGGLQRWSLRRPNTALCGVQISKCNFPSHPSPERDVGMDKLGFHDIAFQLFPVPRPFLIVLYNTYLA